jgi:hypothetical protein
MTLTGTLNQLKALGTAKGRVENAKSGDYYVSKGCTSPFAPIWINAMANRRD